MPLDVVVPMAMALIAINEAVQGNYAAVYMCVVLGHSAGSSAWRVKSYLLMLINANKSRLFCKGVANSNLYKRYMPYVLPPGQIQHLMIVFYRTT